MRVTNIVIICQKNSNASEKYKGQRCNKTELQLRTCSFTLTNNNNGPCVNRWSLGMGSSPQLCHWRLCLLLHVAALLLNKEDIVLVIFLSILLPGNASFAIDFSHFHVWQTNSYGSVVIFFASAVAVCLVPGNNGPAISISSRDPVQQWSGSGLQSEARGWGQLL